MNDLRIRPKSNYLYTASWQELYVLAEHWQSDMDFFRDELLFLKSLIGKYLIWMTKEESFSKVQQIVTGIDRLKIQQEELSTCIKMHLVHMKEIIENPTAHDEALFREEHTELEEGITSFFKEFRRMKKEVFTITEHVMESEKVQHLLTT